MPARLRQLALPSPPPLGRESGPPSTWHWVFLSGPCRGTTQGTSAWNYSLCLFTRAIFPKGRSVQMAGREHTAEHEAEHSTTTACAQVREDVTAGSQAGRPEREGSPPCRAGAREKKGKPNTTERLSSYAQRVGITSKIQAILFTCNSNATLLQKILRRFLLVESSKARIEN